MSEDYASYIPGIQYAESRGQADPWHAVGDHGQALGAFQIQPIMFQDLQQWTPDPWRAQTYQRMLSTPQGQEDAVLSILRMLGEGHYGFSHDRLISAYNTGPTKARKGVINQPYVDTVRRGMRLHKGNPTMNRLKGK